MGKDEFAQLLETMLNDDEAAGRVASGDFTDLAEGELTASERALLSAAGGELEDNEVSGFSAYLKFGDIKGESAEGLKWENLRLEAPQLHQALSYMKLGDIKGE